jgi:hypothetical protein
LDGKAFWAASRAARSSICSIARSAGVDARVRFRRAISRLAWDLVCGQVKV